MFGLVFRIVTAIPFGVGFIAWRSARWAFRQVRTIGSPDAPLLEASPDNLDLTDYPTRLERLETQLQNKIVLVDQQQRILAARIDELAGKPGREDLSRKYQQDTLLLYTRKSSMERILAKVWKTRSILLLRVHLAITARQKPDISNLPDPENPKLDPNQATREFHQASDAIRQYLLEVEARKKVLFQVLPPLPISADPDPTIQTAVTQEAHAIDTAYARLQDQMDRLADNLTYLGDHFATLAVITSHDDRTSKSREAGTAGRLLDEVENALSSLEELATSIDPGTLDAAMTHLAEDISRLEEAGQEAAAEVDASLEVEAILQSSHP